MAESNSVENLSQLAFFRLKRLLDVVGYGTITRFTVTHIWRCCVRGMGSRTDFSHIAEMFEDTKMRSGLYPFFHVALLNDFASFALCMSDRLFESAHCSTYSPSLFVVVCPRVYYDCWNLQLRCEACFCVPMQGVGMGQVVVCNFVHGVYNNTR